MKYLSEGKYLIFFIPFLFLVKSSYVLNDKDLEAWSFFSNDLVFQLFTNSIYLCLTTAIFSTLWAIPIALLLELTDVFGKKLWSILSYLPLGIPLYVVSFIYSVNFQWSSPLFAFMRESEIINASFKLNMNGALFVGFVFSLVIFPYLLIPIRLIVREWSDYKYFAALTLKKSHFLVLLDIVKYEIMRVWPIGATLICLEVLSDFGGVSIFNYETFTTAIYLAWSGFFSYGSAARLAILLIAFSGSLIFLSHFFFKKSSQLKRSHDLIAIALSSKAQLLALLFLGVIFFLSIGFPLSFLIFNFNIHGSGHYFSLILNTVSLGGFVAIFTLVIGVIFIFSERNLPKAPMLQVLGKIGYGVPGNIIAVSIFLSLFGILNYFNYSMMSYFLILIVGLSFRFLNFPISYLYIENQKQNKSCEIVSKTLGRSNWSYFSLVWMRNMKPAIMASFLLVLIEVVKEMPLTLMIRPVGFDTLATKIYEFTSEGEWEAASFPSLIILVIGLSASYFLNRDYTETR